jgi:hypothetical protein
MTTRQYLGHVRAALTCNYPCDLTCNYTTALARLRWHDCVGTTALARLRWHDCVGTTALARLRWHDCFVSRPTFQRIHRIACQIGIVR